MCVVLFGGALWWYLAAGTQMDDFCYLHEFVGKKPMDESFTRCEGPLISTPGQVLSSIWRHNLYWGNARLGSAIIFAANLWPAWLTAIFNAVALSAMFMLMMPLSLGAGWRKRPLSCMLLTLMLWWVLPWHEMMLASTFCINYIWSSALNLWLLLLLTRGRGRMWAVCLLSLVASMMHEGMSSTMDVVLLIICLQRLFRRGWQGRLMIPCLIYAAGSLMIIFSPAVVVRSVGGSLLLHPVWIRMVLHLFVVKEWLFTLTLFCIPVARLYMRGRLFRAYVCMAWPYMLAALTSFWVILMLYPFALRSAWMGNLFTVMVLVRGVRRLHLPGGEVWKRVVAFALLCMMAVWMSAVGSLQNKLDDERKVVVRTYLKERYPLMYVDITYRIDLPWWTLHIPISVNDSQFYIGYHYFSTYMKKHMPGVKAEDMGMVILDPAMRGRPFHTFPIVPGRAELRMCGHVFLGTHELLYRKLNDISLFSFSEPENDGEAYGKRLPWYALRQRLLPSDRLVSHVYMFCHGMPVDARIRRTGFVPPAGCDSVYFYYSESLNLQRAILGLKITSID